MRSISASQSPLDPYDADRDRERGRDHGRVSHSHRRARYQDSPSRSPPAPPSARPQHGQGAPTALPSIHHLHPDLPPPHAHAHTHTHPRHAGPAVQQYSPSEFLPGASYGHGTSAFFAGTSSHIQQRSPMSASALPASYPPFAHDDRRVPFERPLPPGIRPPQSSSSAYPEPRASPPDLESDQEQNESERGPPKKKRRRQALSCTECKRRKIKCDRTHPCGPCARRSEPEKCQWHVIEPVDKYVTRSEWEDLYTRYRVLEERCLRLEKLVVQMHPELAEHSPPYEMAIGHPPALPSPSAPRSASMRAYLLAGPGISGAGTASASSGQRVTPNTPLSALPGPSPRPGPRTNPTAHTSGTSTNTGTVSGADNSASTRSGSAPPPFLGTTAQPHSQAQTAMSSHPPPHSDRRRTSVPGSHASFAAASERYHVQGQSQIPSETAQAALTRERPLTAPSPHNYTLPPPPPPPPPIPEDSPLQAPSRNRGFSGFTYGRSAPESSNVPSLSMGGYTSRASAQPYPSRRISVSGGRHANVSSSEPINEGAETDARYSTRYEREHVIAYERGAPAPDTRPERRSSDPKNGEAQTSEAGNALRHHRSASPACDSMRSFFSLDLLGPTSTKPISLVGHVNALYSRSEDSAPPSPRLDPSEPSTPPPRKRARHGSLYLNIPSRASTSGTPPPAVVVH